VDALRERARRTVHHQLDRAGVDLGHQLARVRSLSPLATLRRGYAVVQDGQGHVVTSVDQVAAGEDLRVRVANGRIHTVVAGTEPIEEIAAAEDEQEMRKERT
jgi:exodeoxyribonuclease VII large subunit